MYVTVIASYGALRGDSKNSVQFRIAEKMTGTLVTYNLILATIFGLQIVALARTMH